MYPRIGISTSFEDGEQRLNHAYVRAVERAGGLPVIAPMLESVEACAAFVRELDGLVMTGGPAVTESLVGALPADLPETDQLRVQADRLLLEAFFATRRPVLGICYGMQMMNALAGGAIYADVERQWPGSLVHSYRRGGREHEVHFVPGSRLAELLGPEAAVNTRHVQALASVGAGFRVAATAPDGVIEAIESEDGTMIGVQFHPERLDNMLPLFRHLIEAAERSRYITEGPP